MITFTAFMASLLRLLSHRNKPVLAPFVLLIAALAATSPDAWSAASAPAPPSNVTASGEVYIQLGPSFVTNYDGAGRLKYLKADVNVRVHQSSEDTLREHMPYLRNQLVVLFSQQLEEDLTSIAGKELLREQALQTVKTGLAHLESQELADQVSDLFFTAFVVQR
ncbi:flagellar basal body-associated FliL family protein [Pseudohongiella nitratireducens]|uniref:flagellar basal body-associated FliL family protein n=1 Tax=Pseudohongiella nitratireducens TaxID=1768907 RepID=UPI002409E427|nr:flagellar basal body-associated FliL family protein [Pseudohongiella nitratireducens]|tara:strand:+ start:1788 stop:2282 length:495 start_codon:yes stop_codon:yes gene_type:complete